MSRKMIFMAMVVFSIMMCGLLAVQSRDAFAGCREDCYTRCCGDEGICNGDDEQSCVSACLKDCVDDGGSGSTSLAPADKEGSSVNSDDDVDSDDVVITPDKNHPPVGGSIEPHEKVPDGKQPSNTNP